MKYLALVSTGCGADVLFSYLLRNAKNKIMLIHSVQINHPYRIEEKTVRVLHQNFAKLASEIVDDLCLKLKCSRAALFKPVESFKVHSSVNLQGEKVFRPYTRLKKFKDYLSSKLLIPEFQQIKHLLRSKNSTFKADFLLYLKWLAYNKSILHRFMPATPWMPFNVSDFLEKKLSKDMTVFEYGSGASTLFLSRRVKKVISVEHDKQWYHCFIKTSFNKIKSNTKYILSEPDQILVEGYRSEFPGFVDKSFSSYVKTICSYQDNSFDFVFVDGRSRVSCFKEALSKVKPGGYLVLDDTYRERYRDTELLAQGWGKKIFEGPAPFSLACLLKHTTFYRKP